MATVRERGRKGGGTSYAVIYRHGTRQASKTFADPDKAQEFASLVDLLGPDRALRAAAERAGGTVSEPRNRLTVDQLAAQFLDWKARDVTERTMSDYRRDVKNWISPWFGHRAAEDVDEMDVQKWVDHMAATGKLSAKTVAGIHTLLGSIYKYGKARTRRLVSHNPCEETELPRRKKKPPKGTTLAEFRSILAAAHERNPAAEDLIRFIGETGWRWSEAAALTVGDVTDDGDTIRVALSGVFRVDGKGKQARQSDEAKSYRAFRPVRLFPESAAIVRRRVIGKGPGELVFTNSRGTAWNQNTFLRETWPGILRDAGLYFGPRKSHTPHSLRHMHVGVCSAAGMQPQEIQRRIGHENISTTLGVYGGMIGDASDEAMAKAAALMSGRATAPVIGEVVASVVVDEREAGELPPPPTGLNQRSRSGWR